MPDQPKSDLEAVCGSRSVRAYVRGHRTSHDRTDNSFPTSFASIFSGERIRFCCYCFWGDGGDGEVGGYYGGYCEVGGST